MPGATVWKIFRARWAIGVLFRDLKQNLSFGTLPCSGKNASDLAVCIPFALIVSLRLKPKFWKVDPGLTVGEMLARIREETMARSIDVLASDRSNAVRSQLRARRDPSRFGQKPIDRAAA